ncbi:MAG TPA: PEGA domain-containing protein [Polyangiaceae bacterium]
MLAVLAVSAGLTLATPVRAESSEADRTTARALAAEGYEALERHDYKVAEDRFRRADALVHAPTIVVDRARALVGLGRLVEAFEAYQLVLREGVPANAPASWKQAAVEAGKEVGAVERRLAWLILRVEGPSDPRVTIDGVALPNASLGARRAIDPGRHTIRVTADGYVSSGRAVTLSEAQEQEISIKLEAPPEVQLEETPVPKQEAAPAEGKRSQAPMWLAFGVGAAGIAVGTVTGIIALNKNSDLAGKCPDRECSEEYDAEVSSYYAFGTTSGIAFGVGVAGVATGIVLLVTGNKSEKPKPAAAEVVPRVGWGSVGLEGRF